MKSIKIQPGKMIIGTVGYLFLVFPLAYAWHLVLFVQTYEELGYFSREEPIIAFGIGSILIQGILLSILFPVLCGGSTRANAVVRFVLMMGGYHWSIHVLAEAAKHPISPLTTWFMYETSYLLVQFILGGIWFSVVYRNELSNGKTPVLDQQS